MLIGHFSKLAGGPLIRMRGTHISRMIEEINKRSNVKKTILSCRENAFTVHCALEKQDRIPCGVIKHFCE